MVMFEIIPTNPEDKKEEKYLRQKGAYKQGQVDANEEQPRQPDVYYSDRDMIDAYNMGYSTGEIQ